mmetsp:Transcript_8954/g.18721  ORF Transcript_8954/g.18721 Transcript_8954/m.18721 type:complete len:113 (+) Transcript_8954:324-662(+)
MRRSSVISERDTSDNFQSNYTTNIFRRYAGSSNRNDSILGKRRELGKVIDEPLAINRDMCLDRCDTRLLAPQGKARCFKKCERKSKNNKNTTDKINGNKRENKNEKGNEKRY